MKANRLWKAGEYVIFGRPKGEKTIAKIIKVNPKRLKVKTLTARGKNQRVGEVWTIPKTDGFTKPIPSNDPRIKAAEDSIKATPAAVFIDPPGGGAPPAPRPAWETPTSRGNFYARYYGSMLGGTITKVGGGSDGFYWFEVTMPDGRKFTCEISRDEEGNGPGFLFGLDNPYDVEREAKKESA